LFVRFTQLIRERIKIREEKDKRKEREKNGGKEKDLVSDCFGIFAKSVSE